MGTVQAPYGCKGLVTCEESDTSPARRACNAPQQHGEHDRGHRRHDASRFRASHAHAWIASRKKRAAPGATSS